MSFYGEMPDSYNLVVNTAHPLVDKVLKEEESKCTSETAPFETKLQELKSRRDALKESHKDKKDEEIPQAEKEELEAIDKQSSEATESKKAIVANYAAANPEVRQLIDLALLANNLLKGEALSNFVKRSIDLMK